MQVQAPNGVRGSKCQQVTFCEQTSCIAFLYVAVCEPCMDWGCAQCLGASTCTNSWASEEPPGALPHFGEWRCPKVTLAACPQTLCSGLFLDQKFQTPWSTVDLLIYSGPKANLVFFAGGPSRIPTLPFAESISPKLTLALLMRARINSSLVGQIGSPQNSHSHFRTCLGTNSVQTYTCQSCVTLNCKLVLSEGMIPESHFDSLHLFGALGSLSLREASWLVGLVRQGGFLVPGEERRPRRGSSSF